MACGAVPMAPIRMFSAVPSGSTVIPLQLLGFCHADFAILDRRLPATRKCLAPADSAGIPLPLLGFCRGDFAILDRRLPATRKCLGPACERGIPSPRQYVVTGF